MKVEDVALLQNVQQDGFMTVAERHWLIEKGVAADVVDRVAAQQRHRRLGAPTDGKARLLLPTRSLITQHELEHMLRLIDASQAQSQFIQQAFESYFDDAGERWLTETSDLWELSARAAAAGIRDRAGVTLLREAFNAAARQDDKMRSSDERFFQVLSEPQWPGLERAMWLRQRLIANADSTWHAGTDVDLSRMYFALHQGSQANFTAFEPEFTTILVEYERRLTLLLRDYRRVWPLIEIERADNIMQTQTAGDDFDLRWKLRDDRKRITADGIGIGAAIHHLNVSTLPRLLPLLPDAGAKVFRDSFLRTAYPIIYPLDERALALLDREIARAGDDSIVAILQTARDELAKSLDATAGEMVKRYIAWKIETAEISGFQHDRYAAYQAVMLELLARQHASNVRAIDLLASIIPAHGEEASKLRDALAKDHAAKSNPKGGRGFGWPDPYGNYEEATQP